MYKTHANFHVSPFYFFNAAVLSDMMDFFCPFTPTQGLLLYCQLNVGAIMQQASFTSKPTLDNFILLVKKKERGWQPCTSVLSCQLIPTLFILHPSITLRNTLFSLKTLNQSNKYFHHTVLRAIKANNKKHILSWSTTVAGLERQGILVWLPTEARYISPFSKGPEPSLKPVQPHI